MIQFAEVFSVREIVATLSRQSGRRHPVLVEEPEGLLAEILGGGA